jgi:hypothetical protein
MRGLFAEWQPQYAAHDIATFPVRDKRPAVKGYLKIGNKVSEQLALKFANDNAFGFACKRSRITVLDVDAPDERLLADALARHGPTPIVIQSGSGNHQAWYRNNGEGRHVRPDPSLPIDILGDGFVVAPPSMGSKGQYRFIQGKLDDLDGLPILRGTISLPNKKQNTLSLLSPSSIGSTLHKVDGLRNQTLWRECMKMARGCRGIEQLMEKAMGCNIECYEPLPADEVLKIVASAWGYEVKGSNWFGHGARVVFHADEVDNLAAADPDAFALLTILRRHHWDRDFFMAKPFAKSLGWTLPRYKAARNALVERGFIKCVHPGGRGPNDPPVYRIIDRVDWRQAA